MRNAEFGRRKYLFADVLDSGLKGYLEKIKEKNNYHGTTRNFTEKSPCTSVNISGKKNIAGTRSLKEQEFDEV
jgi:hypothetical protein